MFFNFFLIIKQFILHINHLIYFNLFIFPIIKIYKKLYYVKFSHYLKDFYYEEFKIEDAI